MEVTNPHEFGTADFGEPETNSLSSPSDVEQVTVTCAPGEWRPPSRLHEFLNDGFRIPLECYTDSNGFRHIIPACNFEELLDLGAVGGLAVLHGIRGFSEEVDYSYRAMFLIHQHVSGRAYRGTRGMKEHLTRQFNCSRDLYLRNLSRSSAADRDVLPADIGRTSEGEGSRLSVTQLTESGRRAAKEAGYRNPSRKVAISFGLLETAKLNPLEVESEAVPALVRTALFDIHDSVHPSEETVQFVTERLLQAIDRHLVDTQEQFDEWFYGPSNTIVKQIAQQKRQSGGRLEREDVRQAMLHLGWRAYEYVGQCVHALMRTIKNSMPDPLNEKEKQLFEHMHERQPYYGDLPAALLVDRMDFLRYVVPAVWNDPENQNHVRVLHRLLHYYAEMAVNRRAADRQSKQGARARGRKPGQGADGADNAKRKRTGVGEVDVGSEDGLFVSETNAGGTIQLIDNLHSPASSREQPFTKVAEHIREVFKIECDAACVYWNYQLLEGGLEQLVTIQMRCECGKVDREIRMPTEEFNQQAESVLGWRRRGADRTSPHADDTSQEG